MESIDYSVVIRTIGKANEKYKKLLISVNKLTPKPKEVIIVLPEGYSLPQQQLGWEKFVFCKKGMVIQRLYGLKECKTKYALFCDDDVEFERDFVSKLYKPLVELKLAFTAGPLYDFLPCGFKEIFASTIIGSACPTLFHGSYYCTVLNTSGYSYQRKLKPNHVYYAQSMPWTCFFANVEKMHNVLLEDELQWLDRNNYGAMDDLTMFYKAYLLGFKTGVIPEALYIHNDAMTSSKNNRNNMLYSLGFNRVVFWHRFLYEQKHNFISKTWSQLCFKYNQLGRLLQYLVTGLIKTHNSEDYKVLKKGYKDGYAYVKSNEYHMLPNIWRGIR